MTDRPATEPCPCGCGAPSIGGRVLADHPHVDPGDGRTECEKCGKWVWQVTHSCKGVPATLAAARRFADQGRIITGHPGRSVYP